MEENIPRDKSFSEMGRNFQEAFGYSNSGYYRASIPLYEKAIQEDKNNFAAFNNIALAKVFIAIEEKNTELINEAIRLFEEAIRITKEVYKYGDGYPIAENNLKWAQSELKKITE